ncbi:hypothetical protein [Psychrobacter sp.]|uniref:hypothetical protein n=1 Tax=Psychrobacter sp. TaxID=56811 RepID=UPI003BB115F9
MLSNRLFSAAVFMGFIALSGCSDKAAVEETKPEPTAKEAVTTEPVVTASTDAVETEKSAEDAEVVVEENPPRFASITDSLALKPNAEWSWDTLASTPDVQKWDPKTPTKNEYLPEDPSYSIWGGLDEHGGMAIYGTKAKPVLITIGSGQGVMEDETGSAVYKTEDLFRANELTPVKSNCDTEEDDLFSQRFYKWQKTGHQPLYIYAITDQANAGTSSDVGIAKSFDEFFNPDYSNALTNIRALNAEYNDITCTFEL